MEEALTFQQVLDIILSYVKDGLVFLAFLSVLIFFHELGHFLFARLFKVRVDVFSIGFGPKIFKWKKGFTQYALSIIPLGGYVKMFGDDPFKKEEIKEEERDQSFIYKGKFARFWIIFGGPLANFILAYFIFFGLMLSGERLPEIRFGVMDEQTDFYSYGLRSGDVLKKINGYEILSPSDMMLEGKDYIKSVTVERFGKTVKLDTNVKAKKFFEDFGKYPPALRKPILVDKNGKFYGLSLTDKELNQEISLEAIAQNFNEYSFSLFPVEETKGIYAESKGQEKVEILSFKWNSLKDFFTQLARKGFRTVDLKIKNVRMRTPADSSGLLAGDIFVSLNNVQLYSFEDLRNNLQKEDAAETVEIMLWREGKLLSKKLTPLVTKRDGKKVKMIGVESSIQYLGLKYIKTKPMGFFAATKKAMSKTVASTIATADGFKKLIMREVSLKNVGGPIAIAQAATDSFNTSLSYFFQIMAIISVNLGLLNLLPIPILDGGHLMFIAIEIINRGPVSRRKLEIAQQIGLSALLLLMVIALFNDFSRFFNL